LLAPGQRVPLHLDVAQQCPGFGGHNEVACSRAFKLRGKFKVGDGT
jgi:hypothetical protein